MKKEYKTIINPEYVPMSPKVSLDPDFFSGFHPEHRKEIVGREARFYKSITDYFSVDDKLNKYYISISSYDGTEIKVKVYEPLKCQKNGPAFVFMHGGGWMTCSVETHDFVPSYIAAKAQIVAFSIEYRLAPEHKFPTGLEDCYNAVSYIRDHANHWSLDPSKISVGGDSSGGNFAAVISQMTRDRGKFHLDKEVLIYPVTDLTGMIPKKSAEVYAPVGGDDGPDYMTIYANPGDDSRNPYLSPLMASDFSCLPETLLINGECDALLDDGLMYAYELKKANVPVKFKIFKGMPHAFILRTYKETFEALDLICDFLKENHK